MAYKVDLLLTCNCIIQEKIETVIYTPLVGENRFCFHHQKEVNVRKVGIPYKIEEKEQEKK